MRWIGFILITFLVSARFDDVRADSPFAPVAGDVDEYLPVQLKAREKQIRLAGGWQTAFLIFVQVTASSKPDHCKLFVPPPLYVFMSMQI